MRTILILIIFSLLSLNSIGQDSFAQHEILNDPLFIKTAKNEEPAKERRKFRINFDWMLETKTEIIHGIWYSPVVEFNLKTRKGLNFQLQTGALPMLQGYQLYRTNPAAGFSISYKL